MRGGSCNSAFLRTGLLHGHFQTTGRLGAAVPTLQPNPGPEQWGVAPSLLYETTKPGEPCAAGKADSQASTGVHLGDVVRQSGCIPSLERQRGMNDYNPHNAPRDGKRVRWTRCLPGAVVTQ